MESETSEAAREAARADVKARAARKPGLTPDQLQELARLKVCAKGSRLEVIAKSFRVVKISEVSEKKKKGRASGL